MATSAPALGGACASSSGRFMDYMSPSSSSSSWDWKIQDVGLGRKKVKKGLYGIPQIMTNAIQEVADGKKRPNI
ncbi:hypothetical protein EJB05_43732, partial [Eragrostis curvula]